MLENIATSRIMPFPLDSDGVPIRPGDVMTDGFDRTVGVVAVNREGFVFQCPCDGKLAMSGDSRMWWKHVGGEPLIELLHDYIALRSMCEDSCDVADLDHEFSIRIRETIC